MNIVKRRSWLHRIFALQDAEGGCGELEERRLMDAPTGAIVGQVITGTVWDISVRYSASSGVNVGSIDDHDVGLNGPNGYAQLGHVVIPPTVQGDGSVLVQYRFEAPYGHWSWDTSGTYLIGLAGGQVTSSTGAPNADAGLQSSYQIFWNPKYRLVSPNAQSGNDQFQFSMPITAEITMPPWNQTASPSADVLVYGPNSFETRIHAIPNGYPSVVVNSVWGSTRRYTLTGAGVPPGGAMDSADNGRYDYRVVVNDRGVERGSFLGASFYLYWGSGGGGGGGGTQGPAHDTVITGVRITSSTFMGDRYILTVNYGASLAIQTSSLGSDDLLLSITRPGDFYHSADRFYDRATRPFRLINVQGESDGSTSAVYESTSLSPGGWSRYESGTMTAALVATAVYSDVHGQFVPSGTLETQTHVFNSPSAINLAAYAQTSTSLEFSYRVLDIDDEHWQYDPIPSDLPSSQIVPFWLASLGRRMEIIGPDGSSYTPVDTYFGYVGPSQIGGTTFRGWNVRMSISLPAGWGHGSWSVYLRNDAIHFNGEQSSPRTLVGTIVA